MQASVASAGGAMGPVGAFALAADRIDEDVTEGAEIPCGAGGGVTVVAPPASGLVFAGGGGVFSGNR